MSYGQEPLPPEGSVEKLPEGITYVRDHIDQPRMQAIVGLTVLGGFAVAAIGVKALAEGAQTEEEREAMRNVPKFIGFAALFYGTLYMLDVDKKWWRFETASKEIEKWIGEQL